MQSLALQHHNLNRSKKDDNRKNYFGGEKEGSFDEQGNPTPRKSKYEGMDDARVVEFANYAKELENLNRDIQWIKRIVSQIEQHPTELIKTTNPMTRKFQHIYMENYKDINKRDFNLIHKPYYVDIFDSRCFSNGELQDITLHEAENQLSDANKNLRNYFFDMLHEETTDTAAMVIYILVVLSIIISVFSTIIATVPNMKHHSDTFEIIEAIVTACFTIEYVSRVCVVRNKFKYMCRVMNVLDFLAILPFYMKLCMSAPGGAFQGDEIGGVGGVLRALRLTRIAKIRQIATPFTHILVQALVDTMQGTGSAVAIFLFIASVMSGTLIYNVEKDINPGFVSIPSGMWWSIVTMTTVGYGDISPQSSAGYILGVFTILIGMSLTSLIIMIIGQYYIDLLAEYEDQVKLIKHLLHRHYGPKKYKNSCLKYSVDTLYETISYDLRLHHEEMSGEKMFEEFEEPSSSEEISMNDVEGDKRGPKIRKSEN